MLSALSSSPLLYSCLREGLVNQLVFIFALGEAWQSLGGPGSDFIDFQLTLMGSLPLWSLGSPDQNRATNLLLWSPVWLVAHFAFFELDSHEHWLAAGQAQIP